MTIQETNKLMERIKQHYQEFIIDDYKIEEWFKELSKYDSEDVNKKLDQHLRSEQYGQHIPKLFFLTKNLITTEEKEKHSEHIVFCQICRRRMRFEEYGTHIERCLSVDYLEKQFKKYNLQNFNKEALLKMTQVEFDRLYDKVLKYVQDKTKDETEKKRIEVIFKSKVDPHLQISINELI